MAVTSKSSLEISYDQVNFVYFDLFLVVSEIVVELVLVIRRCTLSGSIDAGHCELRIAIESSNDSPVGNRFHA